MSGSASFASVRLAKDGRGFLHGGQGKRSFWLLRTIAVQHTNFRLLSLDDRPRWSHLCVICCSAWVSCWHFSDMPWGKAEVTRTSPNRRF